MRSRGVLVDRGEAGRDYPAHVSTAREPAPPEGTARRPDPRPARTRAALIGAAQEILARDARADVSIQEITDTAGVGLGSFYNHFSSKEDLFDAAVLAILELHGDALEAVTKDLEDPLETYVVGVRFTGRLAGAMPMLRSVLLNTGLAYVTADVGLAPRALRDLKAAAAAGRVHVEDIEMTQALVGGMVLGLLQYLEANPEAPCEAAADGLARAVLALLGVPPGEADALVARRLPGSHP